MKSTPTTMAMASATTLPYSFASEAVWEDSSSKQSSRKGVSFDHRYQPGPPVNDGSSWMTSCWHLSISDNGTAIAQTGGVGVVGNADGTSNLQLSKAARRDIEPQWKQQWKQHPAASLSCLYFILSRRKDNNLAGIVYYRAPMDRYACFQLCVRRKEK